MTGGGAPRGRAGGAVLALLGGLWALCFVAANQALAGSGPIPDGVRLVMVETASCIYCVRWHKEIGPAYPLSPEGLRAPLVRRDISDPALSAFRKVVYTPTFLLVRDGVEVGRLTGYPGPDYFWSEIDALIGRLEPVREPPSETRIRFDH